MSNIPNIRFKGFTDAWEQRKVSDLLEERNEQAPESEDYPLMAFIANKGVAPKGERYDRGALVKDAKNKNYKKTELGDFIYSSNNLETGSIGLNNYGNASISPVYSIFKPTGIADSDFIGRRFVRKDFINAMIKWRQGVVYGQWKIHESDFLKIEVAVPSLEEQRKIGSYLNNLDNLITLHQRKCEQMKTLKKYMLQKMFPKNGQSVPEIRFDGFTDAWEQRKFSDFTWNAGKRNKNDLDLEPYAITNEHGFIPQSEAHDDFGYMKDTDRKAYNIVMPNSFAYNPARINVGSIGYYDGTENVIVSSLYEVFQTADYVDDRFLWHWFKSEEFPRWIERLQEGSVRLYFYYDKLCECHMLMPSVSEQQKIAKALDELDNLITLHQGECEKLKKLKKYMLQNMFPKKG
ncbi:type I restriction enzyme, S subunit [Kandleria vitulina]|uniref:Type I restriction enzyme, S subunit n=1 Tax=Kandleria vitulina TaxID=1630 RepID=A0A1H2QVQ5_9FIRM|nr:restriction endonuclease subunit S [Kandleria vitulina]SDW11223.1 type I restriction enzyme, S subunit [Kandleria vitulina]